MDRTRLVFVLTLVVVAEFLCLTNGNYVFNVKHKFAYKQRSLTSLKEHDARRHRRILSAVDLPLGGSGNPVDTGLYYAQIGLGNPSKDYYVQVDTGSDIFWVNCANCEKCPTKSDFGVKLTLYDPQSSSSATRIYCDDDFCAATYNGVIEGCTKDLPCQYKMVYGDGSSTAGFFVRDDLKFLQVTGDLQTAPANGSVIFGCGAKQLGDLGKSSEALDGIIGFGQANSSMISQLAAAGKVKRIFAHCLNNEKGGGIFAIGEVVSPKVNTTPMVPNQAHYNVMMKEIEVGGDALEVPTDIFDSGDHKGTIIDSGTTLAYLPETIYEPMIAKIIAQQPGLKLQTFEEQFMCFPHSGNVSEAFPAVKFHFNNSLTLTVKPHEYLFKVRENFWCLGWQNGGIQSKDGKDMTLLGDMVLSSKLVIYDIENQTIGWTDYDCTSSIKVRDGSSGSVHSVGAHKLSSASELTSGRITLYLLLAVVSFHTFSFTVM